jgi:chemotaxis protein methyltransferase CheR
MATTTANTIPENALIYIRDLVLTRSAIVLEPEKDYLIQARLEPVAKEAGYTSIDELAQYLRKTPSGPLHQKVVEAMTTNETSFFRDVHPFDALKDTVLPEILAKRAATKSLTMWCGAASSGQEPYTLAMLLRENFPQLTSWNLKFLATDISTQMLDKCREGKYSQLEVNRGLPAALLIKYFDKKGMSWRVKDDLINMIEYKQLNLAATWPSLPQMDIVFLRNVLIYFDVQMKKDILKKIRGVLKPDGYLFLGGAETTLNLDDQYQRVPLNGTSCYRVISKP